MATLLSLPTEVFLLVIDEMLITVGPSRGVRLRLVCKLFDTVMLKTLFGSKRLSLEQRKWLMSRMHAMSLITREQLFSEQFRLINSPLRSEIEKMFAELDNIGWTTDEFSREQYKSAAILACAHYRPKNMYQFVVCEQRQTSSEMVGSGTRTAAVAASILGDIATIKKLCTNDIDLSCSDAFFGPPLHAAIRFAPLKVIQVLFELGADIEYAAPNTWRPQTRSAWAAAAERGDYDVFTFIRDKIHSWNQRHIQEVLKVACIEGYISILKKCFHEFENSPAILQVLLELASANGQLEVVKLLADRGVRYDTLPTNSERLYQPFMKAITAGQTAVVQFFISQGASEKHWGTGAIALAAWHGQIEVASLLLEAGFDLRSTGPPIRHETRAPWKRNAAINASLAGQDVMLRWLFNHGLNISRNYGGHFCLQLAVQRGHEDVVAVLLEHGVLPDLQEAHSLYPPPKHLPRLPLYCPPVLLAQMYTKRGAIHKRLLQHGATPVDPAESKFAEGFATGQFPYDWDFRTFA